MSDPIEIKIQELIDEIRASAVFSEYQTARRELRENPDKLKKVQEFRNERYNLQNSSKEIDLFKETDKLDQKYKNLTEDPLIADYLEAENSFFKIIRGISWKLVLDLDIADTLDN